MNVIDSLTPVNFVGGRYGKSIRHIVLHTIVGSLDSCDRHFKNPVAEVSAHYGIGLNGQIRRFVHETNTAWHAGPNYNPISIGIEHEDLGNYNDSVRTDALYNSTIWLCADICKRNNLPPDYSTFIPHRQVASDGRSCPAGLDVNRIVTGVKQLLTAPEPPKAAPAPQPAPQPTGNTVWLPPVAAWRVYPTNVAPVIGNEVGKLTPDKFNNGTGVVYDVVGSPMQDVVTINSPTFGVVNIYVAPSTGAIINKPAEPELVIKDNTAPTIPEWEQTYKDAPGWFRAISSVDVYDVGTGNKASTIHKGNSVNRAGFFAVAGKQYARTKFAKDNGLWTGIPQDILVAAADPNNPIVNSVDGITPPVQTTNPPQPLTIDTDLNYEDLDNISFKEEFKEFSMTTTFRQKVNAALGFIRVGVSRFINAINPFKKKEHKIMDILQVLKDIPEPLQAPLISTVAVGIVQVIKKWFDDLGQGTKVAIVSAVSFVLVGIEFFLSQADLQTTLFGNATAQIVGYATVIYALLKATKENLSYKKKYNQLTAAQAAKQHAEERNVPGVTGADALIETPAPVKAPTPVPVATASNEFQA